MMMGNLKWNEATSSLEVITNVFSKMFFGSREALAALINFNLTSNEKANETVHDIIYYNNLNETFEDSKGEEHTLSDLLVKIPTSKLFHSFHVPKDEKPLRDQIVAVLYKGDEKSPQS